MPRELSKCREWEKDRRERLTKSFVALSKLLPCYDPSIPLSRINILDKAAAFIEELQAKVKEVLSPETVNKAEREEIKKLSERIKKLILRNEQLCNLLKDAGIKVPSECGSVKNFKKSKPWSNRISPEQAKSLAEKENQKEGASKLAPKKTKTKLKAAKTVTVAKPKKRKVLGSKKNGKKVATSKCVIIFSQPGAPATQNCFIITNAPSSKPVQAVTKNTTVVTNSVLLSAPLVTASVKPTLTQPAVPKTNNPLSNLGPGTLILTNGSIVPVLQPAAPLLPQNPTVITTPTPFLLNPQQTTRLVVVTTNSPTKTTQAASKNVPFASRNSVYIKPKRCTTKTVQANKVPIPALTSRYANSCVVFSGQGVVAKTPKAAQKKQPTEAREKQEKVNEKEQSGGEALKRKLEGGGSGEGDVSAVKQQKTGKSCESDKALEGDKSLEAASTKANTTEAGVGEDKVEQKRVSTSYSIDSICKEKEGRGDGSTQKEAATEAPTETNPPTSVDNQALQKNPVVSTSSTPVVASITPTTTTTTVSTSKVDEIPENVLKEIENSESNKTDKTCNKTLEITLQHSDDSNDLFASLHVQSGGQNPESTSPTQAFLMAFPLVSGLAGVKVSEVIEEDNSDSQRGTPTLLQIGTMDTTKTTQSSADNLTPSLLNLDNFSFFSSKDICSSFYQPFDNFVPVTTTAASSTVTEKSEEKKKPVAVDTSANKSVKVVYEPPVTKEVALPAFVSSHSFVGKTAAAAQQKASQSFNNCGQVSVNTTEANKSVNVGLEKPARTQESLTIQQQQQQQQHNPIISVDNTLTGAYNNSYNVNYTPSASLYNTTNHLERKQAIQNQKIKCPPMNTYNIPTTRSSQTVAQCNTFNPFAETVKYTSVCCYNPVTKPYIDTLYTNTSTTYNYNCQPDVTFSQGNYTPHKNSQKPDNKSYYGVNMNYNNSYNAAVTRSNAFSNNYCQMHNKEKFNSQTTTTTTNKNKTANQTRPPVNWMTTPDVRHQSATNNDYFLPCFGKDFENIPSSIYPTATFSVASNTQTTYFNTNTSIYPTPELTYSFPDAKKTLDSTFPSVPISTFQRSDMDENQFTWSPTKFPQLLDPSHSFVSTALPTLVGDLALGTTSVPFSEQKLDPPTKNKDAYSRQKDVRRSKPSNYESHVNFLSVSQLVDHNKGEGMPARTSSRRNSGNRANKPVVQQKTVKRKEAKDNQGYQAVPCSKPSEKNHLKANQVPANNSYNLQHNQEWLGEASKQTHQVKNPSSSYSAEALIGHQSLSEDVGAKQRNNSAQAQCGYSTSNSLPVSFLTDNIIPYFPPVELQQDTSFIQNQNCQNNSFSHNFPSASIQSNTYSSASLIASTPSITTNYLSTTNFMSEIGGAHDYNPIISENLNLFSHANPSARSENSKTCMKTPNAPHKPVNRQEQERKSVAAPCNFPKKSKKKAANEGNVPGFVDFGFLSMPAAINSPILPDDFHANLLPPPTTQLYPCKNPLYPKQNADLNAGSALLPLPPVPVTRSNIQHPEISPSVNNVGSTLTNFNLSTIFPEINKQGTVPLPDIYPDSSKVRDYNSHKNYVNTTQVTFANKSTTYSAPIYSFSNS